MPYTIRERWTGSAVRDTFGYGKVPLSAYIKHRAKGRLDLVLVDEAHQYKGIDSDQGYAMHHLAQAARKVEARLREVMLRFESEHPRLATTVGQDAVALGKLGI